MDERKQPDEPSAITQHTLKNEIAEIPVSLQYLTALSPQVLTPQTFRGESDGASIIISDPRESHFVMRIVRVIPKYQGGKYGVQDEIRFLGENATTQLNFEFSKTGEPIKYPIVDRLESMQKVVGVIHELSTVQGAKIDGGEGIKFVSDGSSWVQVSKGSEYETQTKVAGIKDRPSLES